MLNILKSITEKKIGFSVRNLSDSKRLSEIISIETSFDLNYNTIRRFFGIIKTVKPSNYTLDVLSKFNDFKDYNDFILNYHLKNRWKDEFNLVKILHNNDNLTLKYISENLHTNKNFTLRFTHIIRELILANNLTLVNEIFSLKQMNVSLFSYDDTIFIGTCIGQLLKKINLNKKKGQQIILNKNFQELVVVIYVDYENLYSYYQNILKILVKKSKRKDLIEFCKGVLNLDSHLRKKPQKLFYKLNYNDDFHPILKSRILAQQLFSSTKIISLEKYYQKNNLNDKIDIDYFFEVIFTSMVTKNFEVMKWIIDKLKDYFNFKYFYKYEQYENFALMNLLYFYKIKDLDCCEIWLKLISFDNFNRSYEKMFLQYVYIFQYHFSKNNQEINLKAYLKSSKTMYPNFFTKAYLLNYFE